MKKTYHKWSEEDNEYLRANRPTQSLKQLAVHFGVSEVSIERQLGRLKIYVNKDCPLRPIPVPRKKYTHSEKWLNRPKKEKIVPAPKKKNIEKLWQAQGKKNQEKAKKYKTIERDFSTYTYKRIDHKTYILIPPKAV